MYATKSISDFSEVTHVVDTSKVECIIVGQSFFAVDCVEKKKKDGWVVVGDGKPNGFGNVKMQKAEPRFVTHVFQTERAAMKFMRNAQRR